MNRRRLLFVLGTRPEVIKMAPVIFAARNNPEIEAVILHTGQHHELAYEMYDHFGLAPDYDLKVMKPDQSLSQLSANLISGISNVMADQRFDMVFVQGDTTSAFMGALASFYQKTPVGHIEAGLRTQNRYSPFPEEINRRLVSPMASLHFAPTARAKNMLLNEGISDESIVVTGNTVIDALLWSVEQGVSPDPEIAEILNRPGRLVLVTTHRRENFGGPHRQVFGALLDLTEKFTDIRILFPIHPNPNVRKEAAALLNNHPAIHLTSPLNYRNFIAAMKKSFIILSDSGGVQEEAPSLDKPVLVLRDSTERPEGIDAGALKLVGTDRNAIVACASDLLTSSETYEAMASIANPYGDGKAAERIISASMAFLAG